MMMMMMMIPFENTDISLHFAQTFLYRDHILVPPFQSLTVNCKETNLVYNVVR